MVRKIIFWVVGILVLIAGGIITYIYYNQDIIKTRLVEALNDRLKVPVDVRQVSISALSTFPDAAVLFQNVKISDPYEKEKFFLTAEQVGFSFSIWDLIQGNMVLEEISIDKGSIRIIQYASDKWSYHIYKEVEEKSESGPFSLNIKNVNVHDLNALYLSEISKTRWEGIFNETEASINIHGSVTWINAYSDISSSLLKINNFETLQNQSILTDTELVIDKHWRITTSELKIGDSFFEVIVNKDEETIIGEFTAQDANVQTLLSLMPEQYKKRLATYTSTGNISLDTRLVYNQNTDKKQLSGKLLFNNVSISQQEPKINLTGLNLYGNIDVPDFSNLSNASFSLSGVTGKMNGETLNGNLQFRNFSKPYISASYKGDMPLAFLKDIAGLPLTKPAGDLAIDLTVEGQLSSFSESLQSLKTSGEVSAENLEFYLPNRNYLVEVFTGTAIFTNEHLAINEMELQMGNSHFRVNGQLKNFWNLNTKDKLWSATAEVESSSLMLDELLSIENPNPNAEKYAFHIPPNVNVELKATVDKFQVRQFKANRVAGNINIKNQVLKADRLSFEAMGGLVKLKGEWKDLQEVGSDIDVSFLFAGINADSLFSSFENFNQAFITNKNLSGEIYAEAETSLRLDSNLVFLPNSLTATLKTRIINGELRDFEPLYSLEKYLDNADLSIVKFSELENQIYIQNQTINLPMMAIGTNIIKFKIGGKHTFNQYIDYDVVAPLDRRKRKDRDERFGTIAEDQHGESLIFLSIIGTTKDFEVSLDKQAIKTEIASDVKREVKELQDAFKNNGKTTAAEVELEQDDYFDWEEEEN